MKGEEGGSSRRSRLWIEEGRSSTSSRSKTRVEVEPLRGSRDKAANLASLKTQGGGYNACKGLKEEKIFILYMDIFGGFVYWCGSAPHCERIHDMYGDLAVFPQHCS